MDIIHWSLLLFGIYGITFTLVYSKIMDITKIRPFLEQYTFFKLLLECSFCTSFHISWSYGLSCFFIQQYSDKLFFCLTIPFAFASTSYILDKIIIALESFEKHE